MKSHLSKRAILLVDHGSKKREANEMLAEVAALLKLELDDCIVQIAHMELAEPDIKQGIEACIAEGATEIVVHPYMLAPGRHATEDIPRLAREAVLSHPQVTLKVSPPLGVHQKIAQVVAERLNEAGVNVALNPGPLAEQK